VTENKPGLRILKANGEPYTRPEDADAVKAKNEALCKEIETILTDKVIQRLTQAIIAGAQLCAWGEHYLIRQGNYSNDARQNLIAVIHGAMASTDGTPKPFAEDQMLKLLKNILPFVQSRVKKNINAAKKERAKATSNTDDKIDANSQA